MTWILGILFPLCLFLWIFFGGKEWWQRRQRLAQCLLPGPYAWPIIGNIGFLMGLTPDNAYEECIKLLRRYGKLFRLRLASELVVVLANARDAEVVLSSTRHIEKSIFYKFGHPWLGTGLLTSSGEKWHSRRKILTPTFHFRILENFIDIFNNNADILVSKLRQKTDKPPFDISNFIDLYTQDVICESAMGVQVKAQEDQMSEYLLAVKRQNEILLNRVSKPWLYLDSIFQLSALGKESDQTLTILHGMTKKVIKERKNLLAREMEIKKESNILVDEIGNKRRLAFLDLLLLVSDGGKVLSDEDIREEVDTFMFEGHDTTSSGICFALFELSQKRDIQEKIYVELVEVFGDDLSPTVESLSELKYTEMVIKEALRLHPSVPIVARNLLEEVKLATMDVIIPPGAQVVIAPYGIHRDPEFYSDPEKFNPDNFLPDVVKKRHPFAYVPFSAGPRNCIGQRFAMLEMKATIAKIIWNFILEPSTSFSPHFTSAMTLKTRNGIELRITTRKK